MTPKSAPWGSARLLAALAVFALAATPRPAHAQSLNINFGNYYAPNVSSGFGGAAGQTGTWNWISQTGTTAGLSGLDGSATGVSLALTADTANGGFGPHAFSDVQDLADSNFFDYAGFGGKWSVILSDLQPGTYDVYVYAPANIPVQTTPFTINGVSEGGLTGDKSNSATLIPDASYGEYSGFDIGADGTLTLAEIDTSNYVSSGVAGLQIVRHDTATPAPEPSSVAAFALTGLFALGLVLKARRRTA